MNNKKLFIYSKRGVEVDLSQHACDKSFDLIAKFTKENIIIFSKIVSDVVGHKFITNSNILYRKEKGKHEIIIFEEYKRMKINNNSCPVYNVELMDNMLYFEAVKINYNDIELITEEEYELERLSKRHVVLEEETACIEEVISDLSKKLICLNAEKHAIEDSIAVLEQNKDESTSIIEIQKITNTNIYF